jgi:hypothetical protein
LQVVWDGSFEHRVEWLGQRRERKSCKTPVRYETKPDLRTYNCKETT